MGLHINDIDIDLFTDYFSNNLLADQRSDLITEDTLVKGLRYKVTVTTGERNETGQIKNQKDHKNLVYTSPVPLEDEEGDNTLTFLYRTGIYDFDKGETPAEILSITFEKSGIIADSKQQLYTSIYPENNLYELPSFSEYTLYIKKNPVMSSTLHGIDPKDPSTYTYRVPFVKIYNFDNTIPLDDDEWKTYLNEREEVHQEDLQISPYTSSYNVKVNTPYKFITLQEVTLNKQTYYEGNMNLDFVVPYLMQGDNTPNIQIGSSLWLNNVRYILEKDITAETRYVVYAVADDATTGTGGTNKMLQIGLLVPSRKSTIPVFTMTGQPLFMDKYGNKTTVSSTPSQFVRHNKAIRENYFSIIPSTDTAAYLFAPNLVGLCQVGSNYKFIQTMKFKQTYTFKSILETEYKAKVNAAKASKQNICKRAIINPEIAKYLNGDTTKEFSYSKIVRYSEDVLDLAKLPHYMYFDTTALLEDTEEFSPDNNFFILDEMRRYRDGDIIILDEVDPSAKTKVVNKSRLGIIRKGSIGTLFRENDIIVCDPIQEIDDAPILDPMRYLQKTHNQYYFTKTGKSVNGIPTVQRTFYYRDSLELDRYYSVTETWSGTEDESAAAFIDQAPAPWNGTFIKYDQFEFLKYNHIVVNDDYVDWSEAGTGSKPVKMHVILNWLLKNKVVFYRKQFGDKYFDIIRVVSPLTPGLLLPFRNYITYIDLKAGKAPSIKEYIEHFSSAMHYIADGYIESRGKRIEEGASKEAEKVVFSEMLKAKVNNVDENAVWPEISEFDPDLFSKYKIISDAVINYNVKNNMKSTYSYTRSLYGSDAVAEDMDMILQQRDKPEEKMILHTDETIKAHVAAYSKTPFQRIQEYDKYPTNYIRVNSLKGRFEDEKKHKSYSSVEYAVNEAIAPEKPVYKKQGDIEEFYELIVNTIVTSLQYNDPNTNDDIMNRFNEQDYERINHYLSIREETQEETPKMVYISAENIREGLSSISDIVKYAFGEEYNKDKQWAFQDVQRGNMKLDFGGKLWQL